MTARYRPRGRSEGDVASSPSMVKGRSNCTPTGLIGRAETADARSTPGTRDPGDEVTDDLSVRRRRRVPLPRKDHVRSNDAGRAIAGLDRRETDEAADQQARADQEHEGQRHFGHDHDVRQPASRAARRGPAALLQDVHDVGRMARHAGTRPKRIPAAIVAAAAKVSTGISRPMVSARGTFAGISGRRAAMPHQATSSPTTPRRS